MEVDHRRRGLQSGHVLADDEAVHDATCAVACSAEIIGSKWTALLVHDLSEGARRFSELEHACPGISPRTLSERLRWLEEEGVVVRHSYAETPPRVEYELTAEGPRPAARSSRRCASSATTGSCTTPITSTRPGRPAR